MVTSGLLVRVEAEPDRADDVEAMFKAVVDKIRDEGLAVAWFALRLGPTSFAVVDVFTSDADRDVHLAVNGPALELAEEVLERLAPDVRDFLLETSVLDRLCGELCDAVTGRPGGQVMLERIERVGLFVIPLDEERGWYRYHHLFAELLEKKLSAERSGLTPAALHHAAAAWHAARGVPGEAARHALAAGEPEWAGILIEQYFDAVYFTGEKATLARWLAALPADLVHRRTPPPARTACSRPMPRRPRR